MGTDIARHEPIPLPDLRRPDKTPSWPVWLASRLAVVKREDQPDPATGKYRSVMTVPKSSILSPSERIAAEQHATALRSMLAQTAENHVPVQIDGQAADSEDALLAVITKMMKSLPSGRTDELGIEVSGETYLVALDDVPVWSVVAALRLWYRGESVQIEPKQPHDFRWRPAPATLRRLAIIERWHVQQRLIQIENVIRAEPLLEFSEEHKTTMKRAIQGLFIAMRDGRLTPGFSVADALALADRVPPQEEAPRTEVAA